MNRRRAKQPLTIALFPFLAVLVCTMGCLIVLLVVQLLNARAEASSPAAAAHPTPEAPSGNAAAVAEREGLEWQMQILGQQRDEMTGKLAEHRMELGHLEDHIARLQQRLEELKAEVALLKNSTTNGKFDRDAAAAIMQQLEGQIAEAEKQLAETQAKARARRQSFAVVPYDGPNGTRRRPIYVECLADGVVLQPEGIRLSGDDFQGPLDLGNPLDAALRVTREYWARTGGPGQGEPYPLLLVRPGGAEAYAAARAAMQSWDAEFGYELLDADMELAFPPPDEALTDLLRRTLAEARSRQKSLVAAAPALYARSGSQRGGGSGGFRSTGEAGTTGGGTNSFTGGGLGQSAIGQPSSSSATASGGNATDASAGNAAANSGATPGGTAPTGSAGGQPGGTAAGTSGNCIAQSRGRNWALPNGGTGVPITRPLRVACQADRLVLLPESGERAGATEFSLGTDARAAVEKLAQTIAERTHGWGLAGPGLYWKPVLKVQVLAGGESAYETVFHLLENSGLVLERVP